MDKIAFGLIKLYDWSKSINRRAVRVVSRFEWNLQIAIGVCVRLRETLGFNIFLSEPGSNYVRFLIKYAWS